MNKDHIKKPLFHAHLKQRFDLKRNKLTQQLIFIPKFTEFFTHFN